MSVTPAPHKEIIHKKTTKFCRIQSDRFKRVKPSWRLTRGIDSRFRKQERGTPKHPSIGYGTDNEVKHMLACGFVPVIVCNMADLEALLTKNTTHCALISGQVGGALRAKMIQKAQELNIHVENPKKNVKRDEEQ